MHHDLILYDGKIITLDSASTVHEAIAVRNGRVSAVGSTKDILSAVGTGARLINLQGRSVLPGFFDAHAHMDREGLKELGGVSIEGLYSIAEICKVIERAANNTPEGEWIVVMPIGSRPHDYVSHPAQLLEERFPNRHDLDQVAPNHPVYIRAPWAWWSRPPYPSMANTLALAIAGVDRSTAAPYNTEILKDETGEPIGVFLDRNGAPIVEFTLFYCLPRFTYEDRVLGIELSCKAYSSTGTTSVYEGHGLTPLLIDAYREVERLGKLTVRVHTPLSLPTEILSNSRAIGILHDWSDRLAAPGRGSELLSGDGITLDVQDPEVARILGRHYPYEAWAGHFYQSLSHDRFVSLGIAAARLGIRINCVVCYDLERVLRAYEAINEVVPLAGKRWVIMHVIDASSEQINRIKKLGLVATVTPNFIYMANDRFGLHKLREQGVPIRELLDAEIPVALSSDNVPHSMLFVLWQALVRWDNDSKSRLGESRLAREEALRIACQTGHLCTWQERRRGSLELGKDGDIVVLGADPLTCGDDEIKDIPVDLTFLGGREVHGSD